MPNISFAVIFLELIELLFFCQMAEDLGGPRKEFFDLILHGIKEKYFYHGLRWDFGKDYETVGLVMGK